MEKYEMKIKTLIKINLVLSLVGLMLLMALTRINVGAEEVKDYELQQETHIEYEPVYGEVPIYEEQTTTTQVLVGYEQVFEGYTNGALIRVDTVVENELYYTGNNGHYLNEQSYINEQLYTPDMNKSNYNVTYVKVWIPEDSVKIYNSSNATRIVNPSNGVTLTSSEYSIAGNEGHIKIYIIESQYMAYEVGYTYERSVNVYEQVPVYSNGAPIYEEQTTTTQVQVGTETQQIGTNENVIVDREYYNVYLTQLYGQQQTLEVEKGQTYYSVLPVLEHTHSQEFVGWVCTDSNDIEIDCSTVSTQGINAKANYQYWNEVVHEDIDNMTWLTGIIDLMGGIFSLQITPNLTFGTLAMIPFTLAVLPLILGIVRGKKTK